MAAAQTRITAGAWRGRLIQTPHGLELRPTRSMVRESLFNILGERIVDAVCIDLYAGAGTLGFEALSRGAASVTFVDRDRAALLAIAGTAARLRCEDRCRLVRADAVAWLQRAAADLERCDVCFMDAPYQEAGLERALGAVAAFPPRLVVCEHHHRRRLPERIGSLVVVREVRHGLTTLTFLQPTEAQAST